MSVQTSHRAETHRRGVIMVGFAEVDATGIGRDGREHLLLRGGRWAA